MAGTRTDIEGTNGSFTFNISLSRGNAYDRIYNLRGTITATKYVTPVGNESAETSTFRAYANKGTLHVSGLRIGEVLSIYNLSGQLIYI